MRKGLLFMLLCLFVLHASAQKLYTLKNANLEFSIDEKGNLRTLKRVDNAHNYAASGPLWRMYYDVKREKDIQVFGKDNVPVVSQHGNKILLNYDQLKVRGQNVNFRLQLSITLEEDNLRFGSNIQNNQAGTVIREMQFPLLNDIQIPTDHRLMTTARGGHIWGDVKKTVLSRSFSFMGPDHHFREINTKYPVGVSANCFALLGENCGLYFGGHDPSFQVTGHGIRVYPDKNKVFNIAELGLYKFPNCLSGESWSDDTNVIYPYKGSWKETSKIYRQWANTWWKHREEPEWVKNMLGFQRVILKHQYGETFFKYNDFAHKVKDAGKSVGINISFPFGWWDSGMDNGYPNSYYECDPDQGGDDGWKKAIADYKKDGGKVILYYNGKLIDTESQYYKNGEGVEVSMKSSSGAPFLEQYRFYGPSSFTGLYNARSFVTADHRSQKWKEQLYKMVDRTVELGGDCVFYDQLGYAEGIVNWSQGKEFAMPDLYIGASKAEVLKEMHDYIERKNYNIAIGTEHITDITSQHVDFTHGLYNLGSWTVKGNTNFLDWFRLTFPEVILSERDIDGNEANVEWLVNRSMLYGLRTNLQTYRLRALITETPRLQKHLAQINEIKERYKSLLLAGTYKDTEGFSSDHNKIEARSYVNGNQMAIILAHPSAEACQTTVKVPKHTLRTYSVIGKTQVSQKNGQITVTIPKDGLAVLVLDRSAK